MNTTNYGLKIKEMREKKGISQRELAQAMNMTQRNISHIERSGRPYLDNVIAICEYLKVPLQNFFYEDVPYKDEDLSPEIKELAMNIEAEEKKNPFLVKYLQELIVNSIKFFKEHEDELKR